MSAATATNAGPVGTVASSSGVVNEHPVPSITLSITQDDVKRVLEASEALTKRLDEMQQREEESNVKQGVSPFHNEPNRTNHDKQTQSSEENEDRSNQISRSENADSQRDEDDASGEPPLRTVSCDDDTKEGDGSVTHLPQRRPLHDLVYAAARQCDNSMLKSFLERMKNSGSSSQEIRAGVMVFSDIGLTSKIEHIFDVLGGSATPDAEKQMDVNDSLPRERSLTREGALSMFRAVIVAISSCIHKNARLQIEMDKDAEPPASKRRKPNTPELNGRKDHSSAQDNHASSGADSIPSLQSPTSSFDSAVAPLKDENEFVASQVRKEFQDIAMFARDRLVRYALKKSGHKNLETVDITFTLFQEWRKAEGARIAPWLDLLDLSRWKTPQRSIERNSANQQQHSKTKQTHVQPQQQNKVVPASAAPVDRVKTEEYDSTRSPPVKACSPPPSLNTKENQTPEISSVASKDRKTRHDVSSTSQPQMSASQTPVYIASSTSRTILSFDFSASPSGSKGDKGFIITISEENLRTFRNLVRSSGLLTRSCQDVASILWEASRKRSYQGKEIEVVPIERFHTCLHQLLGSGSSQRLSRMERDIFSSCFVDFFSCFTTDTEPLEAGEALGSELVVGFCFLCAGNKSKKLATGFDLLEHERGKGLSNEQLVHFLRSYLTMLAGMSFLTSSADGIMKPKLKSSTKKTMYEAVENGARWTVSHFLGPLGLREDDTQARHTFDSFASWYSSGGYNVAPWLELLDLKKLLCLVPDDEIMMKSPSISHEALPMFPVPKTSSPDYDISPHPVSRHHVGQKRPVQIAPTMSEMIDGAPMTPFPSAPNVLFTFPLANHCSLVVLKEDASYVRDVVDQLGLLRMSPEEVWTSLFAIVSKRSPLRPGKEQKHPAKGEQCTKTMVVEKRGFIESMQEATKGRGTQKKKRTASGISKSSTHEILANFFQSFDLLQRNRVALNELMGGLTLLCGGKKSTKLSFAFSVFDRRQNGKKKVKKAHTPPNSLDGEELFLFLRSFLIVMFSCCRQSWDLTDDMVNRYIADTANMVADDVIRYQWSTRKKDRVDFDEFGQWYNEGGFELAPWLELLDLRKWVLIDDYEELEKQRPPPLSPGVGLLMAEEDCPPPPPDADVDPSFFDDDAGGIMHMDSIDEMDLLLMPQPSPHKDDLFSKTYPFSPKPSPKPQSLPPSSNAIKFHILTKDNHDGYVVSVSEKRIRHLRLVLLESGLHEIDGERACREILGKAQRDGTSPSGSTLYTLTKQDFDSAVVRVITSHNMSVRTQTTLTSILREVFAAFDVGGSGKADAFDIACGFAVLCRGKKSDKLEYAFEILDRDKLGFLSREDTIRYLRSFLVVLLIIVTTDTIDSDIMDDSMTTMSGEKCDLSVESISRAIEMGCRWASDQAMKNSRGDDMLSFDEFAAWYTRIGYGNIPWLELLDLNKWILNTTKGKTPTPLG